MTTKFGQLFRDQRQAAGRTMGDVARCLGVSVTFVSDVERETRPPFSAARILTVSREFGYDSAATDQLLTAAAESRGAFELETTENATPTRLAVGAALMRGWPELTDDQLKEIELALRRTGGR